MARGTRKVNELVSVFSAGRGLGSLFRCFETLWPRYREESGPLWEERAGLLVGFLKANKFDAPAEGVEKVVSVWDDISKKDDGTLFVASSTLCDLGWEMCSGRCGGSPCLDVADVLGCAIGEEAKLQIGIPRPSNFALTMFGPLRELVDVFIMKSLGIDDGKLKDIREQWGKICGLAQLLADTIVRAQREGVDVQRALSRSQGVERKELTQRLRQRIWQEAPDPTEGKGGLERALPVELADQPLDVGAIRKHLWLLVHRGDTGQRLIASHLGEPVQREECRTEYREFHVFELEQLITSVLQGVDLVLSSEHGALFRLGFLAQTLSAPPFYPPDREFMEQVPLPWGQHSYRRYPCWARDSARLLQLFKLNWTEFDKDKKILNAPPDRDIDWEEFQEKEDWVGLVMNIRETVGSFRRCVEESLTRDTFAREAAEGRDERRVLSIRACVDERVVILELPDTGEQAGLRHMKGKGPCWSVLYSIFRRLALKLADDLRAHLSDDEMGWVRCEDLGSKIQGKSSGDLRTEMTRLRKAIKEATRQLGNARSDLITLSKDRRQRGYRLEGRVLGEHWQLQLDLPDFKHP